MFSKEGAVFKTTGMIFLGLIMIVLVLSLASASFWESIKATITGKATTASFNLNISVGNNAPNITALHILGPYDPTEQGPTGNVTRITFYFVANDTDGYQNINVTSAKANFTFYNSSTNVVRTNSSCKSLGNLDAKTLNFSCTVALWYFDPGGWTNDWGVTAYVEDSSGATGQNTTVNFTYNNLSAFISYPGSFAFPSISLGAINQTSNNDPLVINNTANYPFGTTTRNITINATDLSGETTSTYKLYAQNFTIGTSTGGSPPAECGGAGSLYLNKSIARNLTSAVAPYGNLSAGGGAAQENLYLCLTYTGPELTSQAYSTNGPSSNGAWTVAAL